MSTAAITHNKSTEGMLICPECRAECRPRRLKRFSEIRCRRCGARVSYGSCAKSLQSSLAWATAGIFLFIPANLEPILTFDIHGNTQTNLIFTGVEGLAQQGYLPVAALVFYSAIAAPALHLGSLWYVLTACCLRLRWPGLLWVYKMSGKLEMWNLVPVYAAATVVAVVKLDLLGTVEWQRGAFWVLAFSLCCILTIARLDPIRVRERIKEIQ